MRCDYKKFIKLISIILILIGVYFIGYGVGHKNLITESSGKTKIINIDKGKPNEVDFSVFWDAWNVINSKFIKKELNFQKMVYGAISGMIDSLRDPYTVFMNPEEAKMLSEDLEGSFGGIGVEITAKDGLLLVIAPLDGSPAQKAGIKSGDVIIEIDGVEVGEYTFTQAINKIRGEKGTEVILTVLHKGDEETQDVIVARDTISVESVKSEIKEGNIMYVRISQFGDDTFDKINQVAEEMQTKNIKKMIVDVRDDPGGYLDTCIDVTSLFIPEGVVVWEEDRNSQKEAMNSTHLPRLTDIDLIVLINKGSASSSEIFAGAIQDTNKGILIGETTFGKGSVQNLEELPDGSQVKVTVAKWLTPDQRQIEDEGIKPDIEIEMDTEKIGTNEDIQLQKAIDELK